MTSLLFSPPSLAEQKPDHGHYQSLHLTPLTVDLGGGGMCYFRHAFEEKHASNALVLQVTSIVQAVTAL